MENAVMPENFNRNTYGESVLGKRVLLVISSVILVVVVLGLYLFVLKNKSQFNDVKKDFNSAEVEEGESFNEDSVFSDLVKNEGSGTDMLGAYNFPESGKVMEHNKRMIIISSKDNSERPRFDVPENRHNYSEDRYDIIDVPEQNSIKYISGYFEGWEDINGSLDKYLIIKYPPLNETEKFRVCFEESVLFEHNVTRLLVEHLDLDNNGLYKIEVFDKQYPSFISLTFDKVGSIIKEGDTLVVVPLFDAPEYNKKDQSGYNLASEVYIRSGE